MPIPRPTTAELLRVAELPTDAAERLGLFGRAFTAQGDAGPACVIQVTHSAITGGDIAHCLTHDALRCAGTDRLRLSGLLPRIRSTVTAGA